MGKREGSGTAAVGTLQIDSKWLALRASFFAFLAMTMVWYQMPQAAAQDPKPASAVQPKSDNPPEKPAAPVPWKRVPDAERKVLAPLEAEWASFPPHQQRRLLGAAKHYPALSKLEQDRFQERLRGWSTLSPDQRRAARDKFSSLNNLPPEKQDELKARWQQEKQADRPSKDVAPPAPTAR